MTVVGYGGGTDSTAMLVGLWQRQVPVDLILFADPGGEQPHTYEYLEIMERWLLEHGMPVAPDNYAALHACLNNGAADIGKLLLDRGIDLERYQIWAEKQRKSEGYMEAMEELAEYWAQMQTEPQQNGPSMGDMSL